MLIALSQNGIPIRLTEERWQHIVHRHPEMLDQRERVLETIAEPDVVNEGRSGELVAVRLYLKTPLTRKSLKVAYREINSEDGFVLTAYLSSSISVRRVMIWKP